MKKYFDYFQDKNVTELEKLYHPDIILNEWNTNFFEGKQNVIQENINLFNKFKTIKIDVLHHAHQDNVYFNMLQIQLDETKLKLIDVLYIDKNNLITRIDVFKGW